MFPVPAN